MLVAECLQRYQHVRQVVLLTDDTHEKAQFYGSLGLVNTKTFNNGALTTFARFKGVVAGEPADRS